MATKAAHRRVLDHCETATTRSWRELQEGKPRWAQTRRAAHHARPATKAEQGW
jgi:hypothetical protein